MHKYYYTYKITLLKGSLAGHYYYGQHRTNNLNDDYCGSGIIIKKYFKQYDKIEGVTYVKEILKFYNDLDELNLAESELVGDKWCTDKLCLNLRAGGGQKGLSEESRQKIVNALIGRSVSAETRQKLRDSHIGKPSPNKGKTTSEETRQKLRDALKGKTHIVSEESKMKMSKARKGIVFSEKHIEALKGHHSNKGKHWKLDPETQKRIYY